MIIFFQNYIYYILDLASGSVEPPSKPHCLSMVHGRNTFRQKLIDELCSPQHLSSTAPSSNFSDFSVPRDLQKAPFKHDL